MSKKILILTNGPNTLARLSDLIGALKERDGSIEVVTGIISNVFINIDGENTSVVESVSGLDMREFDLIIFRSVSKKFAEAALAISIYCDRYNVPYIDSLVASSVHKAVKLASMMALWAKDVPVPHTMYGPTASLVENISTIGLPAIFKATAATHGDLNYKIKSADEISKIVDANPDDQFVLQNYIENDGDYRILVVNGTRANVEHRKGDGLTHLNNESAGGTSTPIEDVSKLGAAISVAKEAAKAIGLEVAGVDIIVDKDNQPFVIEVNRAPQLTSKQEFAAWAAGIAEILHG